MENADATEMGRRTAAAATRSARIAAATSLHYNENERQTTRAEMTTTRTRADVAASVTTPSLAFLPDADVASLELQQIYLLVR